MSIRRLSGSSPLRMDTRWSRRPGRRRPSRRRWSRHRTNPPRPGDALQMEGRDAWVEQLLGACDRALARLEEHDDADPRLVADLNALRKRLADEMPDAAAG